jgi:DNA-binding MarR family transcriptional regulator
MDAIVAQWRRERPDLDTSGIALLGRLFRASNLADAALAEGLRGHRLRGGWFDILAALRRSGEPFELNPTELMRTTMLSSGGMTKRLDRMAEAGLIERRQDRNDRRGVMVRLTARGRAAIDSALEGHVANEARLLKGLTRAERRALDDLLRKVLAGLGDPGRTSAAP